MERDRHKKRITTATMAICAALIFPGLFAFASPQLFFSADLIRHGVRAPLHPIKGRYAISWSVAPGEILPAGILQEYRQGKRQRAKYLTYHLLPIHCVATGDCCEQIIARCTGYSRTRKSAQSFLKGLFPLYNTKLKINTVAISQDRLMLMTHQPEYKKLLGADVYKSARWLNKENVERKHFERWANVAGYPIKSLKEFIPFGDAIVMRRLNNRLLPNTLSTAEIQHIVSLFNWAYSEPFRHPKLSKIVATPIIDKIFSIAKKRLNSTSQVKYLLLSGHDDDLVATLSSLGLSASQPDPASIISFEFYLDDRNVILRIYYNHKLIRELS